MAIRWQYRMYAQQYAECVEAIERARHNTARFLRGAGWAEAKIQTQIETALAAGYGYEILEKRNRTLAALDALRLRAFAATPEAWRLMQLSALMMPKPKLMRLWGELTEEQRRVARWVSDVRELRAPDEWPDLALLNACLQNARVVVGRKAVAHA